MTEQAFLDEMTDLMDTEQELAMDTALADIEEWDSLSHVAFMAYAATHNLGKVSPQEVKQSATMHDLYGLLTETK